MRHILSSCLMRNLHMRYTRMKKAAVWTHSGDHDRNLCAVQNSTTTYVHVRGNIGAVSVVCTYNALVACPPCANRSSANRRRRPPVQTLQPKTLVSSVRGRSRARPIILTTYTCA